MGLSNLQVNVNRFRECSIFRTEIRFYFASGDSATLEDIAEAIKNGMAESPVPFGDIDQYPSDPTLPLDYHLARIIYFINHPEEIRDIRIRNPYWVKQNMFYAYPDVVIADGYHRMAAAFYLGLETVEMSNYDFLRDDVVDYLVGVSDCRPERVAKLALTGVRP